MQEANQQNTQNKSLLEAAGFKCKKCGYYSPLGKDLEINKEFRQVLCNICNTFAPIKKEEFDKYLSEKIEWQNLETFRKSGVNRASHAPHKAGMILKAKQGKLVARPPFGYRVKNGELLLDEEDSESVRSIFKEFISGKSLNQISKPYGISVNGIKKILRNFSYLGKIRFDKQISQGNHAPIISPDVFNQAQKILENKNKKVFIGLNTDNSNIYNGE